MREVIGLSGLGRWLYLIQRGRPYAELTSLEREKKPRERRGIPIASRVGEGLEFMATIIARHHTLSPWRAHPAMASVAREPYSSSRVRQCLSAAYMRVEGAAAYRHRN